MKVFLAVRAVCKAAGGVSSGTRRAYSSVTRRLARPRSPTRPRAGWLRRLMRRPPRVHQGDTCTFDLARLWKVNGFFEEQYDHHSNGTIAAKWL